MGGPAVGESVLVRFHRQRRAPPEPDHVPPDLLAWAQVLDGSRLSEQTVKRAEEYLREYRQMHWAASREVGFRLASVVSSEVSPPPPLTIAPLDIIATAVAVRRKQLGIGLPSFGTVTFALQTFRRSAASAYRARIQAS